MPDSVAIPLLEWRGPREIIHGEVPHQTGAYFRIGGIGFTALLDSGNLMEPVLSLDTADAVGLPRYPFKAYDGHHNPGHSVPLELMGLPSPIQTAVYVDFYQGPTWSMNVVPLELFTIKYSVDIMPGYAIFSERAKGNVPYVLPPKSMISPLPPGMKGPIQPKDIRPLGPGTGVPPIMMFEVDGIPFRAILDTGGDPLGEMSLNVKTGKKIGLTTPGRFPLGPILPPEAVSSWGEPSNIGAQSYIVPVTIKGVGTFECVTTIHGNRINLISIAPFLRQNWQVIFHEDSADFIPPGGWGWWE